MGPPNLLLVVFLFLNLFFFLFFKCPLWGHFSFSVLAPDRSGGLPTTLFCSERSPFGALFFLGFF